MQHSLYDRSGSFLNWKFLHQDNQEGQYSLLMMSQRIMARGALKILCDCMNCIFSACEEIDSSDLHLLESVESHILSLQNDEFIINSHHLGHVFLFLRPPAFSNKNT